MEVQLVDRDGNVIDSRYSSADEFTVTDEDGYEFTLVDNRLDEDEIEELRKRVSDLVAEPHSEEGQEVIGDTHTGHVAEVWEDGEITSTKDGDLYGARSIHQMQPPIWPEGMNVLFGEPEGEVTDDHTRMVILDREALEEVLDEYK